MIAIGIDPDTKSTGIGVVELLPDGSYKALYATLARAKGRKASDRREAMARALHDLRIPFYRQNHDVIGVVEWMKLRPKGEKNPNAIVDVNGIAGMCVSNVIFMDPVKIYTPIPSDWKGTVPKKVFTNRILSSLSLTSDLTYATGAVVPGAEKMPASMRTHAIDGLGLAVWALKQYTYELKLKARSELRP